MKPISAFTLLLSASRGKMFSRGHVLLLHGIDDTSALFARLILFLQKLGWQVHTLNLIPNNGETGLHELAAQVQAYVNTTFAPDQTFSLIGFSMGGIVARYYLQRLGGLARVPRLITISSPHRGTWTAHLRRNAGASQMRPGSGFLTDLDADRHVLKRIRFTSIWTPLDLMILPAASSVIPEADCIRIIVSAHPFMVRDKRVFEAIRDALQN